VTVIDTATFETVKTIETGKGLTGWCLFGS
jgi:hypothetical protein